MRLPKIRNHVADHGETVLIGKLGNRHSKKAAMVVLLFKHQPFVMMVYGVLMICKQMDGMHRRIAQQEQARQPYDQYTLQHPLFHYYKVNTFTACCPKIKLPGLGPAVSLLYKVLH